MLYNWDENKRNSNIQKHGIDFVDAAEIFSDPNRIEAVDERTDYGEERLQTIGYALPGILFVVYTYRDNKSKRRLISARKASKKEQALYNSQIGQ
ncbi:MAG: BrnT family toxin [Gammaproteobacteria bacterium]|nr:BrnT family toxin [Gammaproteobacteria bacterium]